VHHQLIPNIKHNSKTPMIEEDERRALQVFINFRGFEILSNVNDNI
jgi:hypothetical protein